MLGMFKSDTAETLHKELLKNYIDEKKIQSLINRGVDINKKDEKGRTLLFELAAKRRIESIKILIKNGIDINAEDNYGKTVLAETADKMDSMMIRFLLDNGSSVNHINSSGRTVLQDAALEENEKVFKVLMSYNPDLSIRDNYGRTVLFDAVEGGNFEIIKEVVSNLDDINIVDYNGQTVLFNSVLKDDDKITKYLIESGIDVNIVDNKKQNVLFNAVILGSQSIPTIEKLIEVGIELNIKDIKNKTLLDEILKILAISRLEDVRVEGKYRFVSEDRDYLKLTEFLINNELAINEVDSEGKTVLYKEVERENYDTINFLLTSGADINAQDNEGKTVLFDAVLKGPKNINMVDHLISNGANIDHQDFLQRTVVDDLCEAILITQNNKKPTLKRFLKLNESDDYLILLKKILIFKPKLNRRRKDGKTLIFDLIVENNFELIKQVVNAGADLNIEDYENNTPLSYMIDNALGITDKKDRQLFLERLTFILKFRVDIENFDKNGRTILHKAVIADDIDIVEKILSKKVNVDLRDKQGRTALHHTQWKGNYKIARLLILSGADINAADYAGFTILNYAAILGHVKLVIVLISSGVLMYNHNKKSKSVALFFKEKEKNLNMLTEASINDEKMKQALEEVVINLKKEIEEILKG